LIPGPKLDPHDLPCLSDTMWLQQLGVRLRPELPEPKLGLAGANPASRTEPATAGKALSVSSADRKPTTV
jgi:hypothetical protein